MAPTPKVCASHGEICTKIDALADTVKEIKNTLMGEDNRGGVVADVSDLKRDVKQILMALEERKVAEKAEIEWSLRKKVIIYTALSSLTISTLLLLINFILSGGA